MRTFGKWAILTHDELDKIKDLSYQRGLRSKWKARKNQSFVDDVLTANRGDTTTEVGKILNRNVVTYGDSLPIVEDGELAAEIDARFNMKESEMEDAA